MYWCYNAAVHSIKIIRGSYFCQLLRLKIVNNGACFHITLAWYPNFVDENKRTDDPLYE